MIPFKAFSTLIAIISGARDRETREHREFLEFYEQLVRITPQDIAVDFKLIKASTIVKGVVHENYQLELSVTDLTWWREIILVNRGRFINGTSEIQKDIWDRLSGLLSKNELNEEFKELLLDAMKPQEQFMIAG